MRFKTILLLSAMYPFSLASADPSAPPPPVDRTAFTESLTEISVVGDAPYAAAPDFLSLDIRLEQTAANAADALSQLDSRNEKLKQAASSACPEAIVRSRGDKFIPLSGAILNLKSGTPLSIQRTVSVDCGKIENSGKLVDAVIAISGNTLINATYSVRDNSKAVLEATALAGKRGQEKALALANSLGVKLGPLVSSVMTEEPEGDALREQLHQGQPALDYGDKELHVYVALRYSIAK